MEPKKKKKVKEGGEADLPMCLCRGLYAFAGEREGDLSFNAGEVIQVIQKNPRWWAGITQDGRTGVFPSNYVEEIEDEEEEEGQQTTHKEKKSRSSWLKRLPGRSSHSVSSSSSSLEISGPLPSPHSAPAGSSTTPSPRQPSPRGHSGSGGSAALLPSGGRVSNLPFGDDVRRELEAKTTGGHHHHSDHSSSSTTTTGGASGSLDEIEARLNRLKFGGSDGDGGGGGGGSGRRDGSKSYRVSQLLAWEEVNGHIVTSAGRSRSDPSPPPTHRPKAKKYFEEVAQLQRVRDNYVRHALPLLEAKTKEFEQMSEDYLQKLRVSAEESGVASEIVQKLIDAERDRVKLVSWSLFHPEALDMHPLESDISERTQVLETEQCIITAQSFVRRWLVRRRHRDDLKLRRQRRRCAMEIVKTERSYVDNLRIVVQGFMVPLQQAGLLTNDDKAKLFSNVELILGVNETILEQLEERAKDWSFATCLGDVFLALSPFLRMYTTYINNYTQAVDTFQRLQQQPNFAQMVEKCRDYPEGIKLSFQDYQIMPVQRIPRYVLLVEELLKYTPEGHPDQPLLADALALLREVAIKINEHRRWTENMQKLIEIQQSITGFSEELVQPSRRLVHEGEVTRVVRGAQATSPMCYLFLFNDILVITERRRYMFEEKYYYTFKEQISLNNMNSGTLEGSATGFVLRTKYGVVESFLAASPQQRDDWVRHLDYVINDLRRSRASLRLDASGHDLPSRSSSSHDITQLSAGLAPVGGAAADGGTDSETPRKGNDGQHALIAALSSLSVPTTAGRQQPPIPGAARPTTPTPPSSQNAPPPPLASASPLGEVVNVLSEALALERDIFQRPIEIQTIMPDYCRSIHPQQLQMLGDRLRLLHAKLNEIRFAQQKVKALLLKAEPINGVHNLDSLIKDGRTPIGDLKAWVQQSFPPTNPGGVGYGGYPPQQAPARTLMAGLLKWYLSLSDSWQALLAQPPGPT